MREPAESVDGSSLMTISQSAPVLAPVLRVQRGEPWSHERMAAAILRGLTCAVCGAPRTTAHDAVVVLCHHCGALLAHGGDGRWSASSEVARHVDGVLRLVRPSAAEARLARLAVELHSTAARGDRGAWRVVAEEHTLLAALLHPGAATPLPDDPAARAGALGATIALQEIATFDPAVRTAMSDFGAVCARLTGGGDPVVVARELLERARGYFRALKEHPDAPPGALREGVEHHARALVRQAVDGYAPLLASGIVERVRVEVLGDALVEAGAASCPRCGAPLPERGLTACAYCGAVTRVDDADAWTAARLALWEVTLADLARTGRLDGAAPVVAALGSLLYTPASDVPVEKVVALVRRMIPWVSREELALGVALLEHGASEAGRAQLDAVRAASASWVPDPAARPPAPRPEGPFAPPSEAEEQAWIESALATWSLRTGTLLDLVGQPLVAVHLAAMYEQPTGASASAALAFFERAMPGFDRAAALAQLEALRPGYDAHPRVAAFTANLAARLARPTG